MRYIESTADKEKQKEEIARCAKKFEEENECEILEVTDTYFKYRGGWEQQVRSVEWLGDDHQTIHCSLVKFPKGHGKTFTLGYIEDGGQYITEGSFQEYHEFADLPEEDEIVSFIPEEEFRAYDELEEKAKTTGALFDELVLFFYRYLTYDVLNEHRKEIEFSGTVCTSYLTARPSKVLPLTKEAMAARAMSADLAERFEHTTEPFWHGLMMKIEELEEGDFTKISRLAQKQAITTRLQELKEQTVTVSKSRRPEQTPTQSQILDLNLSFTPIRTFEDAYLLQRVYECGEQAIADQVSKGSMKKKRALLAERGREMFNQFYVLGHEVDIAAQEVISKFKTHVGIPAIQKNMNSVFIKQSIGLAGELAAKDYLIPKDAEHVSGTGQPDFVQEDKRVFFEVKFRKQHGHQQSVEWLLRNECAYAREWLSQGYTMIFFYCLYSKQSCEVQEWKIEIVQTSAP